MKKIIMLTVVGGILFAASAAGSWLLMKPAAEQEAAKSETGTSSATQTETTQVAATGNQGEIPTAFKPNPLPMEVLIEMGKNMKTRQQELISREAALEKRNQRLNMIVNDLKRERKELEQIQIEVLEKIRQADETFQKLETPNPGGLGNGLNTTEAASIETQSDVISEEDEELNLRDWSNIIQKMEPERAAELIRELCNDGKMDMAVRLLSFFEERDATKIVTALNDSILMVQLTERYATLKRKSQNNDR